MATRSEVPSECPACHGRRVASILYGLPEFSPELERELDAGRVVLGGCCPFGNDPEWKCAACGHRWGRVDWSDPVESPPS